MDPLILQIFSFMFAYIVEPMGGIDATSWGALAAVLSFFLIGITYPVPQGFPGKAMFDRTQPGGEHAEDVSPLVEIFSPASTPLLARLGMGMRPALNIKHEWLEDELIPDNDTLAAGVAAGDAQIRVNTPLAFQVGELIAIGQFPNIENMEITANPGTGLLSVTRGYGASSAIAHASGDEILLMGECSIEGDDAPDSQKTNMDRPYNITHIFNYTVEMTGTREALIGQTLGDIGDEWAYTRNKRLQEAMRDLEAAVIASDWRAIPGSVEGFQGSSLQSRSMRGILAYMNNGVVYGGVANAPPANCLYNAAGANFTFNNFRQFQQQPIYENGAEEGQADLLIIPPALKVSVARWKEVAQGVIQTNASMADSSMAQFVGRIITDFGPVDVVMHSRLRKFGNVSVLLSSRYVKVVNMISRSFFEIPLGAVGDRRQAEIVGEYTLEMMGVDKGYHSVGYNWTAIP
jgi:hypothetical protein